MNIAKKTAETPLWIVKIGSSLLAQQGQTEEGLNDQLINSLCRQLAELRDRGLRLVLVSSGAVAAGRQVLGWKEKDVSLRSLQAAAAVGQPTVMSTWRHIADTYGLRVAQVLLTHYDLERRKSYLNARATLIRLLDLGLVPIVNENDTLLDEEVCFGNNDELAAMTANLLNADLLVILTDCDGLYDADPRLFPNAKLIKEANAEDEKTAALAGGKGELGRGGMLTKIRAARLAAHSGTPTRVAHGGERNVLCRLHLGEDIGSLFRAGRAPSAARKRWLVGQLRPRGKLYLDDGAIRAVFHSGVSLLPVGVVRAEGLFERGDPVGCYDSKGKEVVRGLVNYGTADCQKLCGKASGEIGKILGYEYEPELIHRDNLVVL